MHYSGVIFDFNGTLFWDTKLHNKAWDIFLDKHHLYLSDEDKFAKMHGRNNKDLLADMLGQHLTDGALKELSLEKELIYQQLCLESDMMLAPGVIPFLDFLKDNAIPFTIATASGKENVDFYFNHLPLSDWFDYNRVVYNNGQIKGKPDPEIYEIAMGVISKKPQEVMVFEDAISGLQAAKNADAGCIIVVDSNDDDYSRWQDCQIIKSFDEVDRKYFKY